MLTLIVVLTRSASVGYEPFAVNLLVDVVLTSRLAKFGRLCETLLCKTLHLNVRSWPVAE